MNDLTHHQQLFNGLRFHYVAQGEGPLVLLLHGFPDFWYGWRFQLPALAAAGFRAVAPDMRGYNLSEKPAGVDSYHISALVEDAAAMLRELGGGEGGFLVGHDWGGIVAWQTAIRHPALVRKLAILNAPHPSRYLQVLRDEPRQRLMSYYIGLFQLPGLPERLLTAGAGVERAIRSSGVRPAAFTEADAQLYRQAIMQPGAATATLNYYRSMVRRVLSRGRREPRSTVVSMPTLLLWGKNDVALHPANAEPEPLRRWVPDLRVEPLEASHWVQLDAPDAVNERLVAFFRS